MDTSMPLYKKLTNPIFTALKSVYNKTHWFTDKEAWMLFRLFAFCETAGWTMLISAIIYRNFHMPGGEIAVSIAGTVHGLLFSMYFIFVVITARSMQWGVKRVVPAIIAGMPPYASLVFEKVMAHDRNRRPVYIEPPQSSLDD